MAMSPKIALILKGHVPGPGMSDDDRGAEADEPESDPLMAAHELMKALREDDPQSLLSALMVIIRSAGDESPEESEPAEGPPEAP